jgi:glycosyltransferase involved in cell wall biosynthesis
MPVLSALQRWLFIRMVENLTEEVQKKIAKIGSADILVGIPSFRNAETIARVVRAASTGMAQYFPDLKPVLVNSDGGSKDNTREIVIATPVPRTVEKIVTPYKGIPGKGSAFATIFDIAEALNVKVCIVVDSDLRSITPEWIKMLGEPVWKHNFGLVTPFYKRYKYDGTITNSLAYPVTRALYGQIIRQPIGGEFGMSGSLAKILSQEKFGDSDIARFGIDIWMTTTAINDGFRVCQSAMGVKLHDAKDPTASLAPMFEQVVGSMFSLMKKYEVKWKAQTGSQPIDLFGEDIQDVKPVEFEVNYEQLIARFHKGAKKYEKIIKAILTQTNYSAIRKIIDECSLRPEIDDELWVKIVYDFAVAYNFGPISPKQTIEALVPLYFGKTANFVERTRYMSGTLAEAIVEGLAEVFEDRKDYLVKTWDRALAREQHFEDEKLRYAPCN